MSQKVLNCMITFECIYEALNTFFFCWFVVWLPWKGYPFFGDGFELLSPHKFWRAPNEKMWQKLSSCFVGNRGIMTPPPHTPSTMAWGLLEKSPTPLPMTFTSVWMTVTCYSTHSSLRKAGWHSDQDTTRSKGTLHYPWMDILTYNFPSDMLGL